MPIAKVNYRFAQQIVIVSVSVGHEKVLWKTVKQQSFVKHKATSTFCDQTTHRKKLSSARYYIVYDTKKGGKNLLIMGIIIIQN
jgi:hypothetical protein